MKFRALMHLATAGTAIMLSTSMALSEVKTWAVEKLDASKFPAEIVRETRAKARNGLPDGLVSTASDKDIRSAWYTQTTTRYTHGILGDAIEAGTLSVKTGKGLTYRITLPTSEVFEDRAPRITDLDNNGTNEVIAIRSSLTKGASVTVYGLVGDALVELATTGFIGTRNRWLNIAGIAPFTGSTRNEIAFVKTPHIGGTLFLYRYANGKLTRLSAAEGFSNHAIGSREMRLSAIADVDSNGSAELAVPSADRLTLRIIGFRSGGSSSGGATSLATRQSSVPMEEIANAQLPSPIDKAIAIQTKG